MDGGGELTAYELATGHARWTRPTTPAAVSAGWFSVLPDAGIVLVPSENGNTVLDAMTGAPLWQSPGSTEAHTVGTVLLRESDVEGRSTGLRLVGARDGRTIWQRPMGGIGGVQVRFGDGRPGVIAVDTGELLILLRYDDGTPLISRRLPDEAIDERYLSFAGDSVLVQFRAESAFAVTAFRLDTLAESWQAEQAGGGALDGCGPVVCLSGSKGIAGLDPVTGVQRWALPADYGIWSVLGDRIVASHSPRTSDEGRQPLVSVIDAQTGRRLGDEVPGQPAVSVIGDGRLLLLRPRPDDPVGAISVYDLDVATGRSKLIGEADYQLLNSAYELVGHHLTRLLDGQLQVMNVG
ncbi:hypothetical protein Asi03nite_15030 [Actinoplanes siamensis]|uniref:Pyrrolo-quinoline quinone repeat domain-containing protein n=1 Tax=Actinoplanes siamensis TaxID=1223317 RepID=A0A919N3Z7_9ACTN|nr:hypothetical protein Asi03nite_15030 [Actinoplanes siamensis]